MLMIRGKKGDASTIPYTKGEGASLMIVNFVSADFGWLSSPDGKQSAQQLFKPGKNCDGYFSNEAINILQEYYSSTTM